MKRKKFAFTVTALMTGTLLAGSATLAELQKMTARYAPVTLRVDTSKLSAGDKAALSKLIAAGRVVNRIFLQQLWSGNPAMLKMLQQDTSPLGKARLEYFWLNKGPWSELDEHKAFLASAPGEKLPGANFYPEHMTKDQFESWAKTLSPEARAQAEGFFTVIRAGAGGKLRAVPYSEEYKADLAQCAHDLRDAARSTDNASLKHFLETRAAAFLSNDYYASDIAWMDLDAPLDITIGPYETYNDDIFGYKAAFEAYVNLRDDAETAKLKVLRRPHAGSGKQSAYRREIQKRENRSAGADSSRQSGIRLGRRRSRGEDGGL
jgi:hypothetical protein